jgi:hypothetical protein
MKSTTFKINHANLLSVLILCSIACFEVWAQNKPNVDTPAAKLNLDDTGVADDMAKEAPAGVVKAGDKSDKVSVAHPLDDSFAKAEKHGVIPTTKEIQVPGAPQRVTKVTGPDGSYCVYSPTVARTDGIDEIQNGLQTQVRSCPQ